MNYTENFNLNLPETTDQFRVDHQNENIRKIDEELYQLNQNATQTDIKIEELKKSVSDGKSEVASSITTMGVETSASATFDTMATNILAIESGGLGEECEPITDLAVGKIEGSAITLSWTLPDDAKVSGIVICYSEVSAPTEVSGDVGLDTNTTLGTDITNYTINTKKSGTFYFSIFTYTYINNERVYSYGSSVTAELECPKGFQVINSSGTFTVPENVSEIDVFLVGGGSNGSSASVSEKSSGSGGNGGKIFTQKGIKVTQGQEITLTIGAGGGGSTIFGEYSSYNGSVKATGGTGVFMARGGDGTDGVYAFDDSEINGIKYGASGGGGSYVCNGNYSRGGTGGTTGAGGYSSNYRNGSAATDNTGSGGGGGTLFVSDSYSAYDGGSGGSGAIVVRWGY